jgi:hypothetical protein
MASLGELTAGLLMRYKSPQFVNNFSEVNTELIDEMKNELATGNNTEAMAKIILGNEEKSMIMANALMHKKECSA